MRPVLFSPRWWAGWTGSGETGEGMGGGRGGESGLVVAFVGTPLVLGPRVSPSRPSEARAQRSSGSGRGPSRLKCALLTLWSSNIVLAASNAFKAIL